ncbi:MAG: MBL fold metallo-hydrolase [Propionicimonas sp.]
MEIAAGVHRIATPLGDRRCDVYLFVGDERALLFDAGVAGSVIDFVLPELERLGLAPEFVSHVVLSHCDVDHYGSLGEVRTALPAATTVAHAADAALMENFDAYLAGRGRPFRSGYDIDDTPEGLAWLREVTGEGPVELRVEGGESIDLGGRHVQLVAVPGHSRGHLALRDDSAGLWAISDAVLGTAVPLADGTAAFPPTYRHVAEYRAAIALVRAARPAVLATAHYGVFEGADADKFLTSSLDFTYLLEARVLAAVRRAGPEGTSVARLLDDVDATVGDWRHPAPPNALAFPVIGHLEELAARGMVRLDLTTSPAAVRVL